MQSLEAFRDTRAIEFLLADNDASTVALTVEAILSARARHEGVIQHLAECENRMARKRARDILARWLEQDEAGRPLLALTELDLSSWFWRRQRLKYIPETDGLFLLPPARVCRVIYRIANSQERSRSGLWTLA